MAVSPDRRVSLRGHAGRAEDRGRLRHRPGARHAHARRQRPARRQPGVHRHRPHRALPARRLVSRQQGHGESDRAGRDRAAAAARSCRTIPTRTRSASTRRIATCWCPRWATIGSTSSRSTRPPARLTPNTPPAVEVKRERRPAPLRVPSRRQARLRPRRARRRGLRVRLRRRPRAAHAEADRQRAAARFPGQAGGRRPARHARRPVPLRLGAHVEHAGRLPGRSGQRHAHGHRQRADRAAAARLQHRCLGPLSCSRSASSPTGCRATRSIRPAESSRKLKEYPMGRNPNWVEIVDLP